MPKMKKIFLEAIFILLIFGLTIYGVFHGQDLNQLMKHIATANKFYLVLSIICVVLFIYIESKIIHYMLNSLKIKVNKFKCFLFSCAGFFFSGITPSASGGQPMQMYYMKKEKIPLPVSTLVLMIVTIAYKFVLVVVGVMLMIFGQDMIHHYFGNYLWLFYLGVVLNVVVVALMLLLVFKPRIARSLAHGTFAILVKLRLLKHTPKKLEKLEASMELYGDVANYLKSNAKVLVVVLGWTFFQRFFLFATTYFVYLALGLSGMNAFVIIILQASISVTVDMLPLPGGMGISETLFNKLFKNIFGRNLLFSGLILSRGISYYVQLLISATMTIVAHIIMGRGFGVKEENYE